MTVVRKEITYRFVDYNEYNNPDNIIVMIDQEKDEGFTAVNRVDTTVGNFEIKMTYEPTPVIVP